MKKYRFWFENKNVKLYYIQREFENDSEAFDAQVEMASLAEPGYEYIEFDDEGE